ncbi:MAG: hypothetical protein NTZ78_00210 [Candidatus Aureabacteria bacterium]|nr:hypothetical protein [Candidatus Auribacterota bacterium]
MLGETGYGRHFRITGDRKAHYGPFDCASSLRTDTVGKLLSEEESRCGGGAR